MKRRLWSRRKADKSGVVVGLGWLSIGVGLTEVLAGKTLARTLGTEHKASLVRRLGIGEIVNGIMLLASRRPRPWLWMRVAGDLADLAALAPALSPRNRRRDNVAVALVILLGVTLLDVASSTRRG